jgi:hypothetical protein
MFILETVPPQGGNFIVVFAFKQDALVDLVNIIDSQLFAGYQVAYRGGAKFSGQHGIAVIRLAAAVVPIFLEASNYTVTGDIVVHPGFRLGTPSRRGAAVTRMGKTG